MVGVGPAPTCVSAGILKFVPNAELKKLRYSKILHLCQCFPRVDWESENAWYV